MTEDKPSNGRVNMTFKKAEIKMIESLKGETGITQTTELIRFCIKFTKNHYWNLVNLNRIEYETKRS